MHTRARYGLLIAMIMLLGGCGTRPTPGRSRDAGPQDGVACTPAAEVCDGVDNDCNGVVDDQAAAACPLPSGAHTVATCEGGLCGVSCEDGYVLTGGMCVPSGVDPGAWSYPEHQFVIDALFLPEDSTSAKELGFDLDGDGTPDNQYGYILSALGSAVEDPWTPQDQMDAAMARGELIHLLAVYAQSLSASATANLWELLGEPVSLTNGPQPGQAFTVTANAPRDLMCAGAITAGAGAFGGAQARLMLRAPLALGSGLVLVPLEAARVAFDASPDGATLQSGRLGGLILEDFVEAELLPELALGLDERLAARCALENGYCTCEVGSGAETIQSIFDTNGDCHVDLEEVRANSIIQTFFKPDIQLPDGRRGLSFAVGFHAVRAAFAHEAPVQH